MKWFKENTFLAGLFVVTLLGAGALGYLLFTAMGKYGESVASFEQQSGELKRLESLPAYPDEQNLNVLKEQRVAHLNLIADLQKSLVAAQVPVEQISPNAFQEQLRTAVTQFTGKAGPMLYPKGFYLGFETYQTALPPPDAAPLLGRELKVIQKVLQTMIDRKGSVSELKFFVREPFAEESTKPKAPEPKPTKPVPGKPGVKAGPAGEPLVKTHAIELTFTADQPSFREVLNSLVTNKEQFLIVRYLTLKNTMRESPVRDPTGAPTPPPTPDPNPPTGKPIDKDPIIVGNEKVEVFLRVEIVDFAPPVPVEAPVPREPRTSGK